MCWILNIETTAEVCSVALSDKGTVSAMIETFERHSHARSLTVFIERILQENHMKATDLSAVAISSGPGSYTGLRIGISVAKGLCYGANLPLIAIPTLLVLTNGFKMEQMKKGIKTEKDVLYIPMIDARNNEVYSAIFNAQDEIVKETTATKLTEETFQGVIKQSEYYCFGSGAGKYISLFPEKGDLYKWDLSLSAAYMPSLAYSRYLKKDFVDQAYYEPLYLKDFIATVPRKNKIV